MSGDASISFSGNLIGDPELRFTPSGAAVCSFVVAVNSRHKDAAGVWTDGPTTFFRCSAWKSLAENVSASLRKGDAVQVRGTIAAREYEDKDGGKRLSWEVRAAQVAASLAFATAEVKRVSRTKLAAVTTA